MKKKFLLAILIMFCVLGFVGCGKSSFNISDYLIEKRDTLFTANDDLYCVTFSTGLREENYNFDGSVNNLIPFGILTISRLDNQPMANDAYSCIVEINDQSYSGFLEKGSNNSYSIDLEVSALCEDNITASVSFTGYTFKQQLQNVNKDFEVDQQTALTIAEKELKQPINNILKNKNVKIEMVAKIMKDHSSTDLKNYYWYIGVISTNGDSLGVLISTSTGEIISKKV